MACLPVKNAEFQKLWITWIIKV